MVQLCEHTHVAFCPAGSQLHNLYAHTALLNLLLFAAGSTLLELHNNYLDCSVGSYLQVNLSFVELLSFLP